MFSSCCLPCTSVVPTRVCVCADLGWVVRVFNTRMTVCFALYLSTLPADQRWQASLWRGSSVGASVWVDVWVVHSGSRCAAGSQVRREMLGARRVGVAAASHHKGLHKHASVKDAMGVWMMDGFQRCWLMLMPSCDMLCRAVSCCVSIPIHVQLSLQH